MSHNDETPGPDQARTRPQRSAKAARASAAAVTSRTAGWIVAAALGGSLVTLLLDHGVSQPATQQVAIRNTGNSAPAPRGRASSRVVAPSGPAGQVHARPGNPQAPWRVYVAPGNPQGPGQVYAGPGNPQGPGQVYAGPGNPQGSGQVYAGPGNPPSQGWVSVAPGSPPAVSWTPAPSQRRWTVAPGCVISRAAMPPFPPRRLHGMKVTRRWRVIIGRVAIARPGRQVHTGRVQIGRRPTCSVTRLPQRAKVHDHG